MTWPSTKVTAVGVCLAGLDKGPGSSHPCDDLAGVWAQRSHDCAISAAQPPQDQLHCRGLLITVYQGQEQASAAYVGICLAQIHVREHATELAKDGIQVV